MEREEYEELKARAQRQCEAEIRLARERRAERISAIEVVWHLAQIKEGRDGGAEPKKMGRPPKPRGPDGKECTKCGEFKPYAEFHKNTSSVDGRNSHCKECRKNLPPTHIDAPLPDHLDGKGHVTRYCSRGRLCLDYPNGEHPGKIPNGSPASVCPRCSRARAYG